MIDVIIVGAGPAGSAAAIVLARAGREVLLLDRADFPRDKPCGDLIGARALATARRLGIDPRALEPYSPLAGALLTTDTGALDLSPRTAVGRLALLRSDARVVPRTVFDHAMVRAAEQAGAQLRRVTVRRVSPWQDGYREIVGSAASGAVRLTARAVVIAGGYGCRVAPEFATTGTRATEPARGIAMRGYFADVTAPPDRIVFSLDAWVLPGYGWVFPLPDGHANVGVGTLVHSTDGRDVPSEHLRELFARFATDPQSPATTWLTGATRRGTPRTWPLDLGPRRRRLVADGIVVAGEAAGLVGPLTGAGIAFALESGARAGEAVATALATGDVSARSLSPYADAIRRRFIPWLRAESLAQRYLSDAARLGDVLDRARPLPVTAAAGARLLLHLG